MSDPTPNPEAPAQEAPTPAEESPDVTPSTSGDSPSVEDFVNDDSLDLESSGLPDPTVKEIKKLRSDAKKWRETASTWEQATQGWAPEDVETLRTALAAGPQQADVVGKWMLESAQALLGDKFSEVAGGGAGEVDDHYDENGDLLTKEQVAKIVQEQMEAVRKEQAQETERQQRVQAIIAETETLGFGPSHPLHEALLSTARHRFDGDLAKAAELLRQGPGAGDNPNSTTQDAPTEVGHTPVPQEGQAPAGTRRVSDPRSAAAERLDKTLGDQRGFPSL